MKSNLYKALRVLETLLMSGFFIIGSFFGVSDYTDYIVVKKIGIIGIVTFFTILSIYAYNAYAGVNEDAVNKRLASLSFYRAKEYLFLGIAFLLIALFFSLLIGKPLYTLFTVIIFIIWMGYAYPAKGLKYKPYWGTVLHFLAQIIHFNLCYYVVHSLNIFAISVSVYFAIAFSIGHLNHEIIDSDTDIKARVKNTVAQKGVFFVLALIVFLCSINMIYVLLLYLLNLIDFSLFFILFIPAAGHWLLYVFFNVRAKDNALLIRSVYRLLYFLALLVFVLAKILQDVYFKTNA